jgi:hypothetical protein
VPNSVRRPRRPASVTRSATPRRDRRSLPCASARS